MSAKPTDLLDQLVAEGRREISAQEARARLHKSPQATTNIMARLVRDGWLERARRGHYLIRNLGYLGVPATSREELGALVAAAAGGRLTRVAYATALHEHDLLSRPWQPIQFAVDRRLFVTRLGDRPVEAHIESAERLALGAEPFGPSSISSVERALLESAHRPRLVGGIATIAEALDRAGKVSEATMTRLAAQLDYSAGLRRLVTLNRGLGLHSLDGLKIPPVEVREIPLDPTDRRTEGHLDDGAGVRWPGPVDELRAVIDY
jgi:predicted transcriptional regulator of viral defense system